MSKASTFQATNQLGSNDQLEVWESLVRTACNISTHQMPSFAACMSHGFFGLSENANTSKDANSYFQSAQALKINPSEFIRISTLEIEQALMQEVKLLRASLRPESEKVSKLHKSDMEMSLVSYEEMDLKLNISNASRTLELAYAEQIAALNMRLASLSQCDSLSVSQNPFRPDIFIKAMNTALYEFNPEGVDRSLTLPLISELLFDLAPIYHTLNQALIAKNILPDLQESYRLKRKKNNVDAQRVGEAVKNEVTKKLEEYFSGQSTNDSYSGSEARAGSNYGEGQVHSQAHQMHTKPYGNASNTYPEINPEVMHYLANAQKNMALHQLVAGAQNSMRLSQVRQEMPNVFRSGVEKHTLDLLTSVFDGVFGNQDIPEPIKELIGQLQIPILKAALIDRNFFFQDAHPARRLIDLMSQYSASWDQQKGVEDPLFQTMQRNVLRVQKEFDQQLGLFDEVVTDLENFMVAEEANAAEALQAPISRALQKEKFQQAGVAAINEISIRVNSGEVHTFVETFLENRWTKVLTLAFSVKEEKPHAIADAIKTMDDLIWSIQPKVSLAQRQEMVNRLPGILARLNKWLSLIKWEDADRIVFFADLAECHASIVRSPLDLSPEKQMEIAVEAAKLATERRLEKRQKLAEETALKQQSEEKQKAQAVATAIEQIKAKNIEDDNFDVSSDDDVDNIVAQLEQETEDAIDTVANLERGVWIQFTKNNRSLQKVRLAWISPMRSLFIFTSSQKEQSFSIAVSELENSFREQRAKIISLDKIVDKALQNALISNGKELPEIPESESTLS
jgi:hypothetical protein